MDAQLAEIRAARQARFEQHRQAEEHAKKQKLDEEARQLREQRKAVYVSRAQQMLDNPEPYAAQKIQNWMKKLLRNYDNTSETERLSIEGMFKIGVWLGPPNLPHNRVGDVLLQQHKSRTNVGQSRLVTCPDYDEQRERPLRYNDFLMEQAMQESLTAAPRTNLSQSRLVRELAAPAAPTEDEMMAQAIAMSLGGDIGPAEESKDEPTEDELLARAIAEAEREPQMDVDFTGSPARDVDMDLAIAMSLSDSPPAAPSMVPPAAPSMVPPAVQMDAPSDDDFYESDEDYEYESDGESYVFEEPEPEEPECKWYRAGYDMRMLVYNPTQGLTVDDQTFFLTPRQLERLKAQWAKVNPDSTAGQRFVQDREYEKACALDLQKRRERQGSS